MIKDEFNRKLKEASSHLQQAEPFTPWLNAAERKINEQKEYGKSKASTRLEDDCLEFQLFIQSNTTHGIHKSVRTFLRQ